MRVNTANETEKRNGETDTNSEKFVTEANNEVHEELFSSAVNGVKTSTAITLADKTVVSDFIKMSIEKNEESKKIINDNGNTFLLNGLHHNSDDENDSVVEKEQEKREVKIATEAETESEGKAKAEVQMEVKLEIEVEAAVEVDTKAKAEIDTETTAANRIPAIATVMLTAVSKEFEENICRQPVEVKSRTCEFKTVLQRKDDETVTHMEMDEIQIPVEPSVKVLEKQIDVALATHACENVATKEVKSSDENFIEEKEKPQPPQPPPPPLQTALSQSVIEDEKLSENLKVKISEIPDVETADEEIEFIAKVMPCEIDETVALGKKTEHLVKSESNVLKTENKNISNQVK